MEVEITGLYFESANKQNNEADDVISTGSNYGDIYCVFATVF